MTAPRRPSRSPQPRVTLDRSTATASTSGAAKPIMTITRAAAAAVLPLCLFAASCTTPGNATPTPVPPTTITSTETDLQRQMRLDYEAAEKAYRTSVTESGRIISTGATQPSAALKAVATGDYLDLTMKLSRQIRQAGYTSTGGTVIREVVDAGYQERKIALISCEDVTGVKYFKDGKPVKTNSSPYYVQHLTITKTDLRTWKVSGVDTKQIKDLEGQPCVGT